MDATNGTHGKDVTYGTDGQDETDGKDKMDARALIMCIFIHGF